MQFISALRLGGRGRGGEGAGAAAAGGRGERHPQGANLGSNGILNFLSKLKQWLPPAHPKSLASQCMSDQPISTCHALTS